MKHTILTLQKQKEDNNKIVMVAAYDYFSAKALDTAGVEMILVGDSLAMAMLGYEDTLSISVDEMLVFTRAVTRGAKDAFVVADMPFMSYQGSQKNALKNATKFIKKGRANGVKIEGGAEMAKTIKLLSEAGIPVIAHIGLMPQNINNTGGYKVQGKTMQSAQKILDDARTLQDAGAFMVLVECVPLKLMQKITHSLSVPTIGIGAGKYADGQVLVWHDLLGINTNFKPKFVKNYANLNEDYQVALKAYIDEVKSGVFPDENFSFNINDEWLDRLY
ncbi:MULTISPECIES: 3-methyl-2-oxobutanoate hydroxymethyltransferase [unclassified Campylobacter]|uniref:3-methyl-2-oxobutanoate hydroxymethyltransferase n=1 Tax=unclassified Campylobacter TaxID=2593542 RepID=UPI00123802A4|nr:MULTISPECIES: 3-methyl-2-oxobutanoate hydroxymethyltransferase [unclassified Campylobacter]KAA6224689.1 3-methyl-2-oxobutanoate hydroxymethyltransferase [Campylobacter sp. LR185c]KAA6225687.1 3-methyl-2-oxobutanoate hydroxymethyltransferase [Campylobacter sp. LR286c]KAA6225807.1 3-methyl-2-oxobutanoate hydroxymethyltransferase [Campylobacter sp. LR196d]KAA6229660.1 3-methyl-2-oxobutanoate hydroxymethyltransferase [Campylobacter sp. LR291e]KAA8603969.1 3-methyl-2-oxobutanoate hydroxymethyltr